MRMLIAGRVLRKSEVLLTQSRAAVVVWSCDHFIYIVHVDYSSRASRMFEAAFARRLRPEIQG
jgi:hypothetical protein